MAARAFAQQAFDARELDEREAALSRLGVGLEDAPPIRNGRSRKLLRPR
jgi:hypothetical protein